MSIRAKKIRLLACFVACVLCCNGTIVVQAGDCQCEKCVSCEPCCPEPCCPDNYCATKQGCNCLICKASKHKIKKNCFFKALDAFAGGVEKALRLDKCDCGHDSCDGGCYASHEVESTPHHHHNHHIHHGHAVPAHPSPTHASPVHRAPVVKPYSGPTRNVRLTPTGPSQWQGAGETISPPVRLKPSHGQHLGGDVLHPGAPPQPVRSYDSADPRMPEIDPKMDRESLFDTMSDPFQDDQTRARAYQTVRPATHDQYHMQPVRRRPLP